MNIDLRKQIAGRCVHFNGIQNEVCKAVINYQDKFPGVKIGIPCCHIATANRTCEKVQYPTNDQVDEVVRLIEEDAETTFAIIIAAKKHYSKTKEKQAKFKCPMGDHEAMYTRADTNGHFWIKCKSCNFMMNE